jgi:hypothetical protein
MNAYRPPVVPDQLIAALTPEILEVHEEWSHKSLPDLLATAPYPESFGLSDRQVRAVVINGDPEAGINVVGFPYQQAWKPSMFIRTMFSHAATNREGVTIVLPNGSVTDSYYELTPEERAILDAGDMTPFYNLQTRTVESVLRRRGYKGKVALKGYSLGGLTSLGIAATPSDELDIVSVHSDEMPNIKRPTKDLKNDFLGTGVWGSFKEQRAAIADAAMPVLDEALSLGKLGLDYVRFGIANAVNKDNKAQYSAMATPAASALTRKALENSPDALIHFGSVQGSKMFLPIHFGNPRVSHDYYSGAGTHGHATGDNPVALALMSSR